MAQEDGKTATVATTKQAVLRDKVTPLADAACFIEQQFPVAKVSMESYKERKAVAGQTLTGLGKWWGRKPLVMVRSVILGLLMPVSDDPIKDREVFLQLMTMDNEGLWRRKEKSIPPNRLIAELKQMPPSVQTRFLDGDTPPDELALRRLSRDEKLELQRLVFDRMTYAEKLGYCCRPEHLAGPDAKTWVEVNAHLGTTAKCLEDLIGQLGRPRFGRLPRVGDSFCGAGSTPFEAARIGCEAYGSDLNPVATLLTWAAVNIVGAGEDVVARVEAAQEDVFERVNRQVTEWGIEHNEVGWRSDAYIYCAEVRDPETNWMVPLVPSWVIAEKHNVAGRLIPDDSNCRYSIEIREGLSTKEMVAAQEGTLRDGYVVHPILSAQDREPASIEMIRSLGKGRVRKATYHDSGLRLWENGDLTPRNNDVYQERLYCVRWAIPDLEESLCLEQVPNDPFRRGFEERWRADSKAIIEGLIPLVPKEFRNVVKQIRASNWRGAACAILNAKSRLQELDATDDGSARHEAVRELGRARGLLSEDVEELVEISKAMPKRAYRAPTPSDHKREKKVVTLLKKRFADWQAKGFIPCRQIPPGKKTSEPARTRGWSYWHNLFTPRQLLLHGLFAEYANEVVADDLECKVGLLLSIGRMANWNSKLSRWLPTQGGGIGGGKDTYYNQALNPFFNWSCRPILTLRSCIGRIAADHGRSVSTILAMDGRDVTYDADIWITDPPYADAVNYHELSEFFLAWFEKGIIKAFPDWYTDSKRALAVQGDDHGFRHAMVECYKRIVDHMPANGLQVVMFTHQDAAVWSDLTMILWAAGLRVTAAWCIATETDSALKQGNYVQGTVLLVCRKRTEDEPVFLDEINHRVESEVRQQLDNMLALDDDSDPNFADADYQLAAYAAALRVLTERPIEEIDPSREIMRERSPSEVGPIEQLIRNAVTIACDHLVPRGIDRDLWKTLTAMERFYLKGLEVETHGECRIGVYQELARGFGVADYADLLESDRANQTRLKTASEFGRRMLSNDGFGASLVRHSLFAVHQVTSSEQTSDGMNWLKTELSDYWNAREKIFEVLDCLGQLDRVSGMDHWEKDSESARLLAGAVRNDHV